MENKKAQGLSVNAIILIVLGVVVLVVLIVGFVVGWGNIKDWIAPSNNVQSVVDACSISCSLGNKYDYCTKDMELKVDGTEIPGTCDSLRQETGNPYGISNTDCSTLCDVEDSGDETPEG